jgi:hypothetical protein
MADKVSGRCYQFEPNEAGLQSVTFDFGSDESQVIVRDERGEHLIRCGSGDWLTGVTTFDPMDPKRRYAASGAWTAPDTYTAEFYLYETPFCVTVTARFEGDKVYFDQAHNVALGRRNNPSALVRQSDTSLRKLKLKSASIRWERYLHAARCPTPGNGPARIITVTENMVSCNDQFRGNT